MSHHKVSEAVKRHLKENYERAANMWSDYCTWANEFNQSTPSLKSWMKGCPRCSKETMEHLTNLKREFEEACEDASSRLVNQSF